MPGSLSGSLRNSRGKNGLCVTPITSTMSATMPSTRHRTYSVYAFQKSKQGKLSCQAAPLYTAPPLSFFYQTLVIPPFGERAARFGLPDFDERLKFFDGFAWTRL